MSRVQIPSPAPKINRPKRARETYHPDHCFLFSSESFLFMRKMRAHGFAPFGFLPIPTNTSIRPTLHRPFSVGLIAFHHKNLPSGNFIVAQSSPAPKINRPKRAVFLFSRETYHPNHCFLFLSESFWSMRKMRAHGFA